VPILRIFALMALALVAGCQTNPNASGKVAPNSCERVCNAQYDACMDRFSSAGAGSAFGAHLDGGSPASSADDVCPDQLKSCLRTCLR
jgi:hypothetical protein